MRKLWFFLIAAALLLSACSQGSGGAPGNAALQPVPTANPSAPKMECKVVGSLVPTPDATLLALFPEKVQGDWTRGKPGAPLRLIEYSDYM